MTTVGSIESLSTLLNCVKVFLANALVNIYVKYIQRTQLTVKETLSMKHNLLFWLFLLPDGSHFGYRV